MNVNRKLMNVDGCGCVEFLDVIRGMRMNVNVLCFMLEKMWMNTWMCIDGCM
jgi:hypothetical protein